MIAQQFCRSAMRRPRGGGYTSTWNATLRVVHRCVSLPIAKNYRKRQFVLQCIQNRFAHQYIRDCLYNNRRFSPASRISTSSEPSSVVKECSGRAITQPSARRRLHVITRVHVASNSSRTSTEKPGRMGEPACSPGWNTPCSLYSSPNRTSTVSVPVTGLAIQYSGIPASA